MKFTYTVATKVGKVVRGTTDAPSREDAVTALLDRGWSVVDVTAAGPGAAAPARRSRRGRLRLLEKMLLAKHLSTMVRSGVTVLEALRVVGEETPSPRVRHAVTELAESVEAGQTLADALASQGRRFDPLFVHLVRVGEASGTLESSLAELAEELRKRGELQRRIRSAMLYPSIVLGLTVVLVAVLTTFVLPRIIPLFKSLNADLPLATKLLLGVATFSQAYGAAVAVGSVVGAIGLRLLIRLPAVRPIWHGLLLRLPVVGELNRNIGRANFCRTLGVMLKSGIPAVEALRITADVTPNAVYARAIRRMAERVAQGQSLYATLPQRGHLFGGVVGSMVRVGEASGNLDTTLLELNDYYDKEVTAATQNLGTVLEPILLIFIGLIVAFVASAIILPIYQFSGSIKRK